VAEFRQPARMLRHRKDLETVRDVGMERVHVDSSDSFFACLSLFVKRSTAIDIKRSATEMHAIWRKELRWVSTEREKSI